jgi:hypothetical protein
VRRKSFWEWKEAFRDIENQIIEKSMEGAITRFTQQSGICIQEFQSKVGSLMHFCVHIRNDVEFPTKQLARYTQKPGKKHMKVADRSSDFVFVSYENIAKFF